MSEPLTVRLVAGNATCESAGKAALQVGLGQLIEEIERHSERGPSCGIVPDRVRAWTERGNCAALAIELKPGPRSVRWLAEDSRAPFGRGARYRPPLQLSFPYVVVLAVFRRGALTRAQLYYRTRPLTDLDDPLFLPNLPNVARGYGLTCWLCLVGLHSDLAGRSWCDKVEAIASHVFGAGFNRSSEVHEGNSYADSAKALDARLASLEAWAEATRSHPFFSLEVPWAPAETTLRVELERMLGELAPREPLADAAQVAGLVARAAARKRR